MGTISRKKKIVLAVVGVTIAVGFLICSAVIILKRIKESGNSNMALLTQRPSVRGIISIELMEKIEDLKETLREDPKNLHAWLKLGDIYFAYNKYREAIEAYSQYLSIDPENPDIRTKRGIMLRGLGDFDGAIEEFRKTSQVFSQHGESRFQLGAVFLQEKKDVKETIAAWEGYLQVEPKSKRASWVRAEIERLKTMKEVKE
jgi:tetratricopeptide (TPR) repeat protein